MRRAAPLLAAVALLAAAPLSAQDSVPARTAAPRAEPGRRLGALRPRTQRPPRAAPSAPAGTRDTIRPTLDTTTATMPPPPGFAYTASVRPRAVTVGERFVSGLAVSVPAGTRVAIDVAKDSADRWRVVGRATATAADSAWTRYLVVAPMVAWVPGLPDTAGATLRLTAPDGRVATIPVALRLPEVRSVLPVDTTKWRVRPPHDVWGASRDWRLLALLAALALLLIALIAWLVAKLVRRRRARRIPATARERALALLERARTSGFIEAGNWNAFYSLVSEALRGLAASLDPRWSTDLTTAELMGEMRSARADEIHLATLGELLRVADLAKFARRGREPDDARRDLDHARDWVKTFAAPASEPAEAVAAEVAP
ncbi:hypothetical protein [Longimicrobium sp.]|uniref:hypothetical protein n=1 Tax=Longimicrobium sp. TaxID=2029185 RepID=UPI002B9A17F4|nr:hypothetical protein [Longimicrobium sp.]HSU12471.1 hypothetical protein [Longimicrobium sp.]